MISRGIFFMRKLYTLAIGIFFCFNMSGGDKTSPQINVGSTPDGKILMEASVAGTGKDESEQLNNLAKGNFEWKALWARPIKTHKEADDLISLTKTMKCNVLIIYTEGRGKAMYGSKILSLEKKIEEDTLKYLIGQAHKDNIGIYAWVVNLSVSPEFAEKHPELMQKVGVGEEDSAKLPKVNPDRENIHGGNWLCPDHGLTEYEKSIFSEVIREFDFDGLALDYIGYRNYYGCFCEYSVAKRQEFADKHPELSELEIMRQFSEDSLVRYTGEIRDSVKTMKKDIKFTIHIYPDFDLNPAYGNRLPVEYCGQTIAWFYKPFWEYGKIYDICMMYKKAEGKFVGYNKFVPFIGAYPDDKLKSEERLRKEIRIAGLASNGTIMFAFAQTFLKHPELAKIVADELSNGSN